MSPDLPRRFENTVMEVAPFPAPSLLYVSPFFSGSRIVSWTSDLECAGPSKSEGRRTPGGLSPGRYLTPGVFTFALKPPRGGGLPWWSSGGG